MTYLRQGMEGFAVGCLCVLGLTASAALGIVCAFALVRLWTYTLGPP